MASGIGIHLGCTSFCVAATKNGRTEVVANAGGERTTPAFVTLTDGENIIGLPSKQSSHRFPTQAVTHIIKLLGQHFDENVVQEIKDKSPTECAIVEKNNKIVFEVPIGEKNKLKQYSPATLLTMLFKNALTTAQSFVGSDVNEVVVTVPENANIEFKEVLTEAVTSAGFEVLRLINNSAASALGYGIGFEEVEADSYNVLVLNIGGQTHSLTLLKVFHGMIHVLSNSTYNFGGDILTQDLANHFASVFEQKSRCQITNNIKAMRKLKVHAERSKHVLSTMPSSACHIDSLFDGQDFNGNISRTRFEMLVSNHLQGFLKPIYKLLEDLKMSQSDITKIILSGGTANIPKLKSMIQNILPNAEILSTIPPEEVSAIGAAMQSGLLSNQESIDVKEEDKIISTSPTNIYVQVNKVEEKVINAGTVLPFVMEKDYEVHDKDFLIIKHQLPGNDDSIDKIQIAEINLGEKFSKSCLISLLIRYLSDGHISINISDKQKNISEHITIKCA